jgi:membrane protein DedA with SNARE-associated domain
LPLECLQYGFLTCLGLILESIFSFICENNQYAYAVLITAILLSGLCLPISEDVMVLLAGGTAARCMPEHVFPLYIAIYFACWFSAWEAYWIGRILGPKLFTIRWFHRFVTPELLERIKGYYQRFGVFTFIIARFIPGGVRNAVFLTSGLTKIHFGPFIIRDGFACLLASSAYFYLGYISGENFEFILSTVAYYQRAAIVGMALVILGIGTWVYYRHVRQSHET